VLEALKRLIGGSNACWTKSRIASLILESSLSARVESGDERAICSGSTVEARANDSKKPNRSNSRGLTFNKLRVTLCTAIHSRWNSIIANMRGQGGRETDKAA